MAFAEFINYSQVLIFAELLGWAMHLHSYLERDKGNLKKKSLFFSAMILLDALWMGAHLSEVISFQRSNVLHLRLYCL